MDPELIRQARKTMHAGNNVLLLTHARPDGDALGSLLGLGHMLHEIGKTVYPVLAEGISSVFRFLPGSTEIRSALPEAYDLCILVDCADRERIGLPESATLRGPDILIDHHITNGLFATINIVSPEATAAAELIADLAEPLGLAIGRDAAVCLLAGLVADTLGFRTPNTALHTLDVAQQLMRAGASLPDVIERSLHRHSFAAVRYWGAGLSHLERESDMVWATLSLQDRSASGYPGRDDADMVNVLSSIDGNRVAIVFIEQEGGKVKVSWRVREGMDVTPLAIAFGGGGHPAASGAVVAGEMGEVSRRVVLATKEWLAGQKGGA
jgi:phosphoesterase RecJ-like protein